jgi:hypothetical protein
LVSVLSVLVHLVSVLSVLVRFPDSNYPIGIFNLNSSNTLTESALQLDMPTLCNASSFALLPFLTTQI